MKKILLLLFPLLMLVLGSACKKNELGGKSTIKGVVMHHTKIIPGARVYIKFDATDFPGDDVSKYDSYVDADQDGNYSFKVYKGEYYLYGVGKDYAIAAPYDVVGGVAVKVRTKETITKTVAVTEGD